MKHQLDNINHINKLDKSDMLSLLSGFPNQLARAVGIAAGVKLPGRAGPVANIVFSGLGGSAIGGDIVRCCLADELKIPFIVNRDYHIPHFVNRQTLFFASSYSGNTEETLSAYKKAREQKARIIALTSGGELQAMANEDGYPVIIIPDKTMPPRCALAYSFVPILIILSALRLIKEKKGAIDETIKLINSLSANLTGPDVPLKNNIAKKTAVDLFGRLPAVYGWSKHLDCVITRWRNQFCENSKTIAMSHFLPEMNHNEIMGFSHPEKILKEAVVIFLRDKDDHPRVNARIGITRGIIGKRVHKVIEVNSRGISLVSRMCSLIYVGDFVSFYLAILNGEDPTPVDEITYLKKELSKRK